MITNEPNSFIKHEIHQSAQHNVLTNYFNAFSIGLMTLETIMQIAPQYYQVLELLTIQSAFSIDIDIILI